MKIKSLKVSDFFILKDFEIEFNNNLSVLIGENGSGKSTILELIADFFGHLHKFFILNEKTAEFVENYEIVYDYVKDNVPYTIEIHSQQYVDNSLCTFVPKIWINEEELSIAQIERKYAGMASLLPQKTILSYAGISDHLKTLSEHYEEKYKKEITKANNQYSLSPLNLPKERPFIYIKPEHLSMLIVSLLISDNKQDIDFLSEYLDIDKNECKISIVFKKPSWTKKAKEKWWGASGNVALQFLQTMDLYADEEDWDKEKNNMLTYHFDGTLNLEMAFADLNAYAKDIAFTIFDTLLYDDLLSEIRVAWDIGNGEEMDLNRLSEGQKQVVLTLGLNSVLGEKGKNLLYLFDEPDVFLHPHWQQKFVNNIRNGLDDTSMAIITSHSPSIVSDLKNQNLHLLRKGRVVTKSLKYYGKTVESILGDYFGLESTRSNDVTTQISSLWKQIQKNEYKSEAFEKEMQELTSILGADDFEIMAMKRDILRKEYEKNK